MISHLVVGSAVHVTAGRGQCDVRPSVAGVTEMAAVPRRVHSVRQIRLAPAVRVAHRRRFAVDVRRIGVVVAVRLPAEVSHRAVVGQQGVVPAGRARTATVVGQQGVVPAGGARTATVVGQQDVVPAGGTRKAVAVGPVDPGDGAIVRTARRVHAKSAVDEDGLRADLSSWQQGGATVGESRSTVGDVSVGDGRVGDGRVGDVAATVLDVDDYQVVARHGAYALRRRPRRHRAELREKRRVVDAVLPDRRRHLVEHDGDAGVVVVAVLHVVVLLQPGDVRLLRRRVDGQRARPRLHGDGRPAGRRPRPSVIHHVRPAVDAHRDHAVPKAADRGRRVIVVAVHAAVRLLDQVRKVGRRPPGGGGFRRRGHDDRAVIGARERRTTFARDLLPRGRLWNKSPFSIRPHNQLSTIERQIFFGK